MSRPSNVDQVVAGIRDLVQAMMAHNEGLPCRPVMFMAGDDSARQLFQHAYRFGI